MAKKAHKVQSFAYKQTSYVVQHGLRAMTTDKYLTTLIRQFIRGFVVDGEPGAAIRGRQHAPH
jgi:hypothetical protein